MGFFVGQIARRLKAPALVGMVLVRGHRPLVLVGAVSQAVLETSLLQVVVVDGDRDGIV